jgi:DNA-binding MarR family transcriptional regulator
MRADGRGGAGRGARTRTRPVPRTADYSSLDFDVLGDLLSFYVRSVNLALSRDYEPKMGRVSLARGTGKVSTLLLVGANPGIRPSVVAHLIFKDRSAMVRLLDQLTRAGLIERKVSAAERRARELYLTPKGRALAQRVRAIATSQSDGFFSVLSEDERQGLLVVLRKLYRHHIADATA